MCQLVQVINACIKYKVNTYNYSYLLGLGWFDTSRPNSIINRIGIFTTSVTSELNTFRPCYDKNRAVKVCND